MNKILHLHRTLNYLAGIAVAILVIALMVMAFQNPIVVVMDAGRKQYFQGTRQRDAISEKDVESFVRDFLEQMLDWEKFTPEAILQQVAPLATSGLQERIKSELTQHAEKEFKGKSISEAITNLRVSVTEKNVVAGFDKVLRIDGVPLVMPTELALSIVRGSPTRWNPMGLYVNGLVEHSGAKN